MLDFWKAFYKSPAEDVIDLPNEELSAMLEGLTSNQRQELLAWLEQRDTMNLHPAMWIRH